MNKKILFLGLALTLLLLLLSCKQKATSTEATTEQDDMFDNVLSGAATVEIEEETEEINKEGEEQIEEAESTDESEDYAAPSCGDTICTYYETFASCPDDCEKLSDTTLYDYPDFLDDPILVVGNNASSTDVITATVISTYLVTHDISSETKLASEVTDLYAQDLILIGNPCENDAIAQLLHYDEESCGDVVTEMNNAVIKLLVFDTNEIIIITGYDKSDTKDASKMLTTDGTYNLNGAEEWINLDSDGDINVYFSKN
ncbi:MAG: hypothetical protein AABX82_05950 [Nanoarchaeota archaeon]